MTEFHKLVENAKDRVNAMSETERAQVRANQVKNHIANGPFGPTDQMGTRSVEMVATYPDKTFDRMCSHVLYAMNQTDDPDGDKETLSENAVAHILRIASENIGETPIFQKLVDVINQHTNIDLQPIHEHLALVNRTMGDNDIYTYRIEQSHRAACDVLSKVAQLLALLTAPDSSLIFKVLERLGNPPMEASPPSGEGVSSE